MIATFIVLALLVGLLAYGFFTQAPGSSIDEELADGTAPPAPSFELEVLSGRPAATGHERALAAFEDGVLALEELRGEVIVLNVWASWCQPCREEAPLLERAWEQARRDGVIFVGLNTQDLSGDALEFVEEFSVGYPTVREQGREVADSYELTGIPETFFIDARGRIVGRVRGVVSAEQLRRGIAAAKQGRVLGAVSGGAVRPR